MKTQGMFITPIFTTDLEKDYDLVNKLYDLKEKDSVGSPKSNVKGWHSKEDLYEHEDLNKSPRIYYTIHNSVFMP